MQPDWDKLDKDYKGSRSVAIVDVDCTVSTSVCGKYGVQGYPSLKAFAKGSSKPMEYNGARDYNSFKRYVTSTLAGPECSLEDKEGCTKPELKILEESEAMSVGDRRAKIKEMEDEMKEKKETAKKLDKEAKELGKTLELMKAGGEKPERVEQLLGDAEFKEHCESRTCILIFLEHILDGGAKARNAALKVVDKMFKKAKAENHPVGFMWLQGGDQFEIEEKLNLQFGFPAVIAANLKKERYGVHRGTFDADSLNGFISSMMIGRVPLSPWPKGVQFSKMDQWDGKDGEAPKDDYEDL